MIAAIISISGLDNFIAQYLYLTTRWLYELMYFQPNGANQPRGFLRRLH